MSDAPERIWLDVKSESEVWAWDKESAFDGDIEYVRATDYDALAAKLAEVEAQVASDDGLIDRCEDVITRLQARAEAAEARIAHLENHIEGVAKDTHKIMVAYEAALPAVYQLALADTYLSRDAPPDPTAAELMARIQTGEKE